MKTIETSAPLDLRVWRAGDWLDAPAQVIVESRISIYVNGAELASFSCTPGNLDHLALGFLLNEGLIGSVDEVAELHTTHGGACIDVWLTHEIELPERGVFTSGCGRGVSFVDVDAAANPAAPAVDGPRLTPEAVFGLMRELSLAARLYERAGGVHTSALSDGEKLLAVAEDVGRHNTFDKLRGWLALNPDAPDARVLLTSGRISSEMLLKAAQMKLTVLVSQTSPTHLAVEMARARGITLLGYVRPPQFLVYTWPERIG